MSTFEILEHPADIGFRVRAETLDQLLAAAAEGLAGVIMDCSRVRPLAAIEIAVTGEDRAALVVNFLNEVLYVLDGRRFTVSKVVVIDAGGHGITAALLGEPRDDQRHPPRLVVKAATYHQLRLWRDAAGWTAEVYLDI